MSAVADSHEGDKKRIELLEQEVESLKRTIAENEKSYRMTMARYVTTEVMEQLASSTDAVVVGERREVTMMFTDLRNSTELSEAMEPEAYIRLLNHYLEDMIFIIDGWKGNILEFAGDSIVTVFGAPQENEDAAYGAVYSAVAMQRHMARVNAWNRAEGYPSIQMGIGIHTGTAIVGCIGSETRMKYDVIGRNMNLAARVEGFTAGGQILVTDETLKAAGDDVVVREGGTRLVKPKGMQEMIRVHDVIGVGRLRVPDVQQR